MNDRPQPEAVVVFEPQRTPHAALAAFQRSFRPGASRTTMQNTLATVARLLTNGAIDDPALVPWEQLRYEHVRQLAAHLVDRGDKPATQALRLGAIRRIVQECWRLGLVDRDTYDRIKDVRPQKRDVNAPLAGRPLDPAEQLALFDAAMKGKGAAASRDTALLVLGLYVGLRAEELATVPLWNGELGVEGLRIRVLGKGGKLREVPIGSATAARLAPWAEIRGTKPGPFLLALRTQGYHAPRTILDHGLSPSGVWAQMKDLGFRARVKDFSPHDLRRTFVTELLEAGVDVVTVARMAGHDDVKTTMRYDRRGEKAKIAAADALEKFREKK